MDCFLEQLEFFLWLTRMFGVELSTSRRFERECRSGCPTVCCGGAGQMAAGGVFAKRFKFFSWNILGMCLDCWLSVYARLED